MSPWIREKRRHEAAMKKEHEAILKVIEVLESIVAIQPAIEAGRPGIGLSQAKEMMGELEKAKISLVNEGKQGLTGREPVAHVPFGRGEEGPNDF